jgi:hypothetical protein
MNQPLSEIEASLMAMCEPARERQKKVSCDPFEVENFKEAIQNMPENEIRLYLIGCQTANGISQDTNMAYVLTCQARCHMVLMGHVKDYMAKAEIYNRHRSLEGDC